jgi:hypothetical protein
MADFCRQCSIEMWGEDSGDLAFLGGAAPTLQPGFGYPAVCEGCGFICVTDYGECMGNCLRKHHG